MVRINQRRHQTRLACAAARWLAPLTVCVSLVGCQSTLDVSNLKNFGRSNADEQYASAYELDEEDDRTPLEKVLQAVGRGKKEAARRNYRPAEGIAEYNEAEKLFDAREYKAAEKEFNRIAKKYKDSQIEEDALFMRAESQFERERYAAAQDGYDTLFEKYPSTRYMNKATNRLFHIARIWLREPGVVTAGDVQQVDFENPKKTPLPSETKNPNSQPFELTRAIPILPNAFDRTRPVFDTEGRALQALKSIWLHDPTGPLADDALMLTASYHFRQGDNMEASRVYKILRDEYPKSQHLQNSYVLGSHVRLMSYQGDQYDGKALEEARQLKESTLRLFPDSPEADRLRKDLRRINEIEAARDWESVVFWEKKGKPRGVATYCRQVIENHPDTKYADMARAKLDELRAEAANPTSFGQRFASALPSLPGRGQATEPAPTRPPAADIPVIDDSEAESSTFGKRLLQRIPKVPRLLRVPGSSDEANDSE